VTHGPARSRPEEADAQEPTRAGGRIAYVTVARRVVGAALVLAGAVWVGQGTDLIQGSSMTGSTFWTVVGALCIVAGLGLLSWPWRQSHVDA
jgi:hypothetical protein